MITLHNIQIKMIFDIENELLITKLFHTVILLILLKPGFAGLKLDRSEFLYPKTIFWPRKSYHKKSD